MAPALPAERNRLAAVGCGRTGSGVLVHYRLAMAEPNSKSTENAVRITILVDARSDEGLTAEHGFSLWVEVRGKRILFDTGQRALVTNAQKLGIDLSQADVVILSHGHYDHTGGLSDVLDRKSHAAAYFHPSVLQNRYSVRDGNVRALHMPPDSMAAVGRLDPRRVHVVDRPMEIYPGVGITGPIPRETHYEDAGGPFYLDPDARSPDAIDDDLALWIATPSGLVLCLGCCHSGLVNTLRFALRTSGAEKLLAVVGGMHLVEASEERLGKTVEELRALCPSRLVTCHCTGEKATVMLEGALRDAVTRGRAGLSLEFPL
jgi:7,8-dihydropterin-6-yl-methyl-4-(beta-D-ribofuranosyl)aminobenzene 5'-phosphate synthase